MYCLNLTLPTPAENLALDEALLDAAEAGEIDGEVLRLWEPTAPCVVVGSSSRVTDEVRLEHCRAQGIPVLRRCSGGAAIVTAPGCLMYALVLSLAGRPYARAVDQAHRLVLRQLAQALRPFAHVVCQGTSDLACEDRKISGNSLRIRRSHLLYHGTLLYALDCSLLGACLQMPPRMPAYRRGRDHTEFVRNLAIDRDGLVQALVQAWNASRELPEWPRARTTKLVEEKYSQAGWNFRF